MQKLDVAGLKIDVISKSELLRLMESRTKTPKQTWSYYGIFGIFIRSLAGTQNNENAKPSGHCHTRWHWDFLGAKILRDAVYCQKITGLKL